ncbi:TOMM precursor leader peptide-binding protein [Fictibacillus enclensis]|uniref:TOMM precursor leader peptide-binding protein n=1 Tax=Fictibacillus enclensis TaxID=1017270 RepID=UPI0024BF6481|nr:TOMM precursor leader peptide-binding protein [Fictibacillus enclensis]WHY72902.1 TOMM precursor leader peptide-binding protein [Fictibacillus enclensis]
MSQSIVIIGSGMLADQVHEELCGQYSLSRAAKVSEAVLDQPALALVLHDSWIPGEHRKAEEVFRSSGIPWLRGFVAFGEACIGPLVQSDQEGCSECADQRRFMAGSNRKEHFQLKEYMMDHPQRESDPWASTLGLKQASLLIQEEVHRILAGENSRTFEHVFLLHLNTLRLSSHLVLPDPYCPVCGNLPKDTAEGATIHLKPSPKASLQSFRCRSLEELEKILGRNYIDHRTGLLNQKHYDLTSPFADTVVNLPLLTGNELCAGRTHSYVQSEQGAILEGLERYCGYAPKGKRTTIYAPYAEVADHALNPKAVGVHTEEQYNRPHFPFQPLTPDRSIDWVWGYSLTQERPLLVPETFAYYSLGCGGGFVYETSNGCALGGSLEEAILYGIFEIVERDSFLMTWYGRLPLPCLDPASINDQEFQLMIERLRTVAGYEVRLYNSTTENGIPSVWAIAKSTKSTGMNVVCAAGAHIDPMRAVKGAVQEIAGMLLNLDEKLEHNREKYVSMYHDSYLVRQMEDHSMLYGLKETEERLSFLLDQPAVRRFDEEFASPNQHPDLLDDLKDILNIFQGLQMEVIVVDQTSPELKRNRLHCVKVIIPGMIPMTFGHHLTRLKGLDRVLNVPAKLGYTKKPLNMSDLNPYPHPFP